MATLFYVVQIILAITLIVVILLQVKSASLGSAFGGTDASIYTSRRGSTASCSSSPSPSPSSSSSPRSSSSWSPSLHRAPPRPLDDGPSVTALD